MVGAKAALLAAALAAAAPALAAEHDVPWFSRNPAARHQWLRACQNDARMPRGACANAERAESLDYARRLARRGGLADPLPPEFQSPIVRDAIGIACRRHGADRLLAGAHCGRRT